ncbi:hypothetical protein ACFP1Z_07550 [Streptomyces gamaensis]|uniref:Type II toxin-antitoxin system RelE/ParE family toxin n=1 Tax=Streptomyces gamaensis TaxID=1763542 RepID=A0ABW0YWW4_9ACTN
MADGGPESDGWSCEFVPDEQHVLGGLPANGRAEVDRIIRGILDLAELRLEAGDDYDEQNPRKLRSVSTDRLILWYQKFDHRRRIYVVRTTWVG